MQANILEESIVVRTHAGPAFALARIQKHMFEEHFLKYVFAPLPPSLCMDIVVVLTLVTAHAKY